MTSQLICINLVLKYAEIYLICEVNKTKHWRTLKTLLRAIGLRNPTSQSLLKWTRFLFLPWAKLTVNRWSLRIQVFLWDKHGNPTQVCYSSSCTITTWSRSISSYYSSNFSLLQRRGNGGIDCSTGGTALRKVQEALWAVWLVLKESCLGGESH